ncbi:MAG: hypothetical protein J6W89_05775 [Paludibacteraceae bacterium]|nr:hypothetical protein [Paludibacteraceae bacterium]
MKQLLPIISLLALPVMAANSPYLKHVYEYMPAPGQFTNFIPMYEDGDDANDMRMKAEEAIADNAQGMISLGGWGGYVVFGFDHPVVNVAGEHDFLVEGNAFYTSAAEGAASGGSCEPGIVLVSRDENGNGKPDDTWYELAGSEYGTPQTIHGFRVTYERTPEGHVPTPDPKQTYRIDTTHVHWTDNQGGEGYVEQLSFHKQPYYPQWVDADELIFEGARLPDNYAYSGSQWVQYPYAYGYVDNHPDTCALAQLNIEWAVGADGTPVHLDAVDFIKVYTALQQQIGMMGETSTEIKGARDLHPDAKAETDVRNQMSEVRYQKILRGGQLLIIRDNQAFNPLGTKVSNTN